MEEFDFSYQSTLRLTTIGSLLAPDFVTEGRSVILEGRPGRGKTHLAIAIAYRALQNGFDALFTTAAELIDRLSAASRKGRMAETLAEYVRPHVLVVDEVGYLAYGDDAANVLYHVVNDRHVRRRSMIFTTNKHRKRWGPALHDDDLADAIVDRILERGRLLRLDGPSVRTKHLPAHELDDQDGEADSRRISGKSTAEFPEPTRATLSCFSTRAGAPGSQVTTTPSRHDLARRRPRRSAWLQGRRRRGRRSRRRRRYKPRRVRTSPPRRRLHVSTVRRQAPVPHVRVARPSSTSPSQSLSTPSQMVRRIGGPYQSWCWASGSVVIHRPISPTLLARRVVVLGLGAWHTDEVEGRDRAPASC